MSQFSGKRCDSGRRASQVEGALECTSVRNTRRRRRLYVQDCLHGVDLQKETSDRSDSDEVYAVIFVGDATRSPPQTRVFRSRVFTGVDQNNVRKQWIRVWGINGAPTEIADPNRLLILCGLMESDSSEPSNVHTAVDQAATAAFTLSIAQGVGHGAMASRVGNAMLTGMRTGAVLSFSPPSLPTTSLTSTKCDSIKTN